MKFIYTQHALENIQERDLSKALIESTVAEPDKIMEGKIGRKIAQKQIGNKLLRIIFEQQNDAYIIVTAYYASAERYM